MRKCNDIFEKVNDLLEEQEPVPPAPPADPAAQAPIPGAPPPGAPPPPAPEEEQPAPLSPAAEVTLVRLLLKALVINLEDDDLDTMLVIDSPEITQENAEEVKSNLIRVIHKHETRGDNEDRRDVLTNLTVNEKNVKSVLNKTINIMKKYSNVDITT